MGFYDMDIKKVPLDVPKTERETYLKNYMEITRESGKLMLFAGDQKVEHLNDDFLKKLHDQIHISGAMGSATGRNIHQKPLDEAIRMCNAIYAVTIEDATVDEALKIYKGE